MREKSQDARCYPPRIRNACTVVFSDAVAGTATGIRWSEVCRRNDRRTPGVRGAGLNPRTRYPAAQRPDADRCARVTAGADVVVCMTCEEEPRPGRPDPLLIYL